jgi:hypothetical protein
MREERVILELELIKTAEISGMASFGAPAVNAGPRTPPVPSSVRILASGDTASAIDH